SDVANHHLATVVMAEWNLADVLGGVERFEIIWRANHGTWKLDLNLVGDATFGIRPEIRDDESAGGSCRDQRAREVDGRQSRSPGLLTIDVHSDRRSLPRLSVLEIAQHGNLCQFIVSLLREFAILVEIRSTDGDFHWRGRTKAHHFVDDVAR